MYGSDIGRSSGSGAATCFLCQAGRFAPSAGTSTCFNCQPGFSSPAEATGCTECGVGTANDAQGGLCTQCTAGRFSNATQQTACTNCEAGKSSATLVYTMCDTATCPSSIRQHVRVLLGQLCKRAFLIFRSFCYDHHPLLTQRVRHPAPGLPSSQVVPHL